MSQIPNPDFTRQTQFGSGPNEPNQLLIEWSAFVEFVLDLTVTAYQIMTEKVKVEPHWEENTFTLQLVEYMKKVLRTRNIVQVTVEYLVKVITPEIESGNRKAKEANEIDLKVSHPWADYKAPYFAWECKRIATKNENKNLNDLIPKYIAEGIKRFVNQEYSKGLADAGMIGYVLLGPVPDIVKAINNSMLDPRSLQGLTSNDHLTLAPSINTFQNVYSSTHNRISNRNPIKLYHLFLTFNF